MDESPKVLVIDDDTINSKVICHYLQKAGYTVLMAYNGEDGIAGAIAGNPDVILLDVMMPGINGFETFERLQAHESTREIPVFFITALGESDQRVKGLSMGAADYITKPYFPEEVLVRIQKELLIHRQQRELKNLVADCRCIEHELRQAKNGLEEQVQIRTAELEAVNRKLINSEQHCRSVLTSSPDPIVVYDADGHVRYANPAFEKSFGCKFIDIMGKPVQTVADITWPHPEHVVCQMVSGGDMFCSEYRVQSKDGVWLDIQLNAALHIFFEDLCAGCIVTLRDISEPKRLAAMQREKEFAESALRAKTHFLSSMNHELRTPLNAIIGFADILKGQYFGDLTTKQAKYVVNILDSGKKLLALIENIMDIFKTEFNRAQLNLTMVSVKSLVETCCLMVDQRCMRQGIELDIQIPQDVAEMMLTVDVKKLKYVMFDLLDQAIAMTPAGIEITLTALSTGIQEPPAIQIMISVNHGSDPVPHEADNGQEFRMTGTGESPLVSELMQMHGGRFWCNREHPQKTRLFLSLPVARTELPLFQECANE